MKVLQAEKKQSKAESDSAIERLRTDMERNRTEMLKDIKSTSEAAVTRIMIAMGISVAFLSGVIGFVGFLLNGNT